MFVSSGPKRDGCFAGLVVEDLTVIQPRVVVDGAVDEPVAAQRVEVSAEPGGGLVGSLLRLPWSWPLARPAAAGQMFPSFSTSTCTSPPGPGARSAPGCRWPGSNRASRL